MQTIKATLAGILAIVACPCHLPLTIPLILGLTAGTALGGWLLFHQWVVWLASTILFLIGLLLAYYWFTRPDANRQCEYQVRGPRSGVRGRSGARVVG